MLDDDRPGGDEVLPGQDRPPLARSAKVAIAVLAGVTALVAVIAVALTGTGQHDLTATPTSASTGVRTSSVPTNSVVLLDPSTGRVIDISPCEEISGDGLNCRTTVGVPHAVTVAVKSLFPKALIDASYTVFGRNDALYTRRLSARAGRRVISLEIGPSTGAKASTTLSSPVRTVARFDEDVRNHHVVIEVVDLARGRTTLSDLGRLARDPRLLAGG